MTGERYLADWTALRDGDLVEIDPQDPESLAAFRDYADEVNARGGEE